MQTLERTTIDAAKNIDLVALIGADTTLRKCAANEWCGPCPKCNGDDRLHCTASWWFCRQCHAKRGDSIEYIRWLKNVSFRQAVEDLAGAPAQPRPAQPRPAPARPAQPRPAQPAQPDWSQRCERLVANGMDRLWSTAGAAGRDYLAGRNLAEHTWLAWRIGFADAFVPGSTKERAPAILLPWRTTAGKLVAIRYRFLTGTPKMTAEPGSAFAGRLFGAQLLPEQNDPVAHRTLLVCEGEFNCMSIWQVSHNSAVDVVSLGSETAHIPDAAVQFAQRYGRRMVWSDKPSVAQRLMQQLGAYGVASPNGLDANDLHQQRKLGGFLATARADAASGMDELLRLVWDLRDAADWVLGLDASSALAAQTLASKIGVDVGLVEAETDRWIPKERL